MKDNLQVAIDGPAGAGKSTIAKGIAKRLGLFYVDTGAMYRAITHKALSLNIPLDQESAIVDMAWQSDITLDHTEARRVYCDGQDITEALRTPEVSRNVSVIAAYAGVRERLVDLQRREALRGAVVMDGRDIGTYVLPEANLKIFLTATSEERAKRRWLELQKAGKMVSFEEVHQDMQIRDQTDQQREVSPLVPAADAIMLDTTGLGVEEIIERIISLINN
ncbi:cytidylate kinase [Desulfitobacterium dichloroeliminans LMG P-21439]|uniref:Cytidylate kinase n=1 Tax=Desulfitobacterium dichloroeliminans (strain LMG P-21439 / DCA1) TaxID=871963 RepID=L0F981_DESDL|nr:(d)CMP kinase [Desulfitobacterium dichloroeliminans]AGA69767.1 cytidylate kinase [Desulfitobacterium dichloroeliminans LMG P-21439]